MLNICVRISTNRAHGINKRLGRYTDSDIPDGQAMQLDTFAFLRKRLNAIGERWELFGHPLYVSNSIGSRYDGSRDDEISTQVRHLAKAGNAKLFLSGSELLPMGDLTDEDVDRLYHIQAIKGVAASRRSQRRSFLKTTTEDDLIDATTAATTAATMATTMATTTAAAIAMAA